MANNGMIYKSEVRKILKISPNSMSIMLNITYYEELKEVGYRKRQHLLTPKQYKLLMDLLGIDE